MSKIIENLKDIKNIAGWVGTKEIINLEEISKNERLAYKKGIFMVVISAIIAGLGIFVMLNTKYAILPLALLVLSVGTITISIIDFVDSRFWQTKYYMFKYFRKNESE